MKILINLKGGLGNQMFQYSTAKALQIKNNIDLFFDISSLCNNVDKSDTTRSYSLSYFNLPEKIATDKEVEQIKYPLWLISKIYRFVKKSILKKHNIGFNKRILSVKKNTYLDGFFQSEKYFTDIRDILLKEFTLKEESLSYKNAESLIKCAPIPVSLHVRRGDYVAKSQTNKYHGTYENDYYQKACEILKNKLGDQSKNVTIFAFSDDPEWVKKEIKLPFPMTVVSDGILKPHEELVLMSKCKHNIIANSSFSWWGAWLNQNLDKIVIAPKVWFKGTSPKVYKDIVPESWIKI